MERLQQQVETSACNCLAVAIIESRAISEHGLSSFAEHLTLEELRIIKKQLVKITDAVHNACTSVNGETL